MQLKKCVLAGRMIRDGSLYDILEVTRIDDLQYGKRKSQMDLVTYIAIHYIRTLKVTLRIQL